MTPCYNENPNDTSLGDFLVAVRDYRSTISCYIILDHDILIDLSREISVQNYGCRSVMHTYFLTSRILVVFLGCGHSPGKLLEISGLGLEPCYLRTLLGDNSQLIILYDAGCFVAGLSNLTLCRGAHILRARVM